MIGPWILTVVSAAVTVLIVLCSRGIIPRNPFAGIRLPAFFSSDLAWRTGHRAAVAPAAVGTILSVAVSGLATALPKFTSASAALVTTGLLLLSVIAGAVLGSRAISREMSAEHPPR